MRDPNDTRDIGPRAGSPLWIHLTTVTAAGAVVFAWDMTRLAGVARYLLGHPLFWLVAMLVVVGEIWPIIMPGRSGPEAPVASLTFGFAAMLYWGFPVGVLLLAVATLAVGLAKRSALHRVAFNAAQVTIAMTAAGLAMQAAGLHPSPAHPLHIVGRDLPAVMLAGLVYFAVNFLLVGTAVALHARTPVIRTLRAALPYQGFVSLVLLATAPLVAIVMAASSALLVLLFGFPLAAIYINAAISVQREHQAHHDELTGLCNRKLLTRRTGDALQQAAGTHAKAGFLLLDLDRFKEINDTLGHAVGDRLLRIVAHRLTHSVRPGDIVGRLGGDEFAVLLPSVKEASAAREVAVRLRAALAEPIRLEGMSFDIEASVGIALYPDDATSFEQLMQHADVAMYLAKERRSGVERYVADSDRNSPARLALLGDLRRGLDRGELELHFQPKVLLGERLTAGMEALVRWQHPVRGMMTPGEFIPLVEQSYLMRELTARVIDMALAQAAAWWHDGVRVQVSLNISARDLLGNGLAETIEYGLERHGLPPDAILLEIDERVLTSEPAHAVATAESLAALGVALSLDDFGTGYSSLVRLKRLPISEVKIDSSFVSRLLDSPDDEVIVKSIVDLARALGIRSVAEGVESAEVASALHAMGCVAAQGWFFSRPLNAASATAWLTLDGGMPIPGDRQPVVPAPAPEPVKPPAGWLS
ncbi:MAG: putative bifunctional diguanylate cyclase/phosphodiesterase [Streptosporangiaceae bacterium]|jgi:diguanylate cyclase (GGDEF)-like protein